MAVSCDIGTMFLVSARASGNGTNYKKQRDCFFKMSSLEFKEMLDESGTFYIEQSGNLYVIGEDALRYSLLTGKKEDFHRPMSKGVVNPGEEEAISMLKVLIDGVLGKPQKNGEICVFTSPASPISGEFDTEFHRMVITNFVRELGYEPVPINEALAIIYKENPTVSDDGVEVPFTGLAMSLGSGMVNLVLAWRAQELVSLSVTKGGDYIDEQVSKVRNLPHSKVTKLKEAKLDLSSGIRYEDPTLFALSTYYDAMLDAVISDFEKALGKMEATIDCPIEMVVAGGTSMVPGFIDRLKTHISRIKLPFELSDIRLSDEPLTAVAGGALVAAISKEKKHGAK